MLFLIDYDRSQRKMVHYKEYSVEECQQAEYERFSLELELLHQGQGINHEIFLLDAVNKEDLLKTHRSIFGTVEDFQKALDEAFSQHQQHGTTV